MAIMAAGPAVSSPYQYTPPKKCPQLGRIGQSLKFFMPIGIHFSHSFR